jgi:hypothetical protein
MKTRMKRQSVCNVCGKRLSTKTPSGKIEWQPSQVDDKGIYCADCYAAKKNRKK